MSTLKFFVLIYVKICLKIVPKLNRHYHTPSWRHFNWYFKIFIILLKMRLILKLFRLFLFFLIHSFLSHASVKKFENFKIFPWICWGLFTASCKCHGQQQNPRMIRFPHRKVVYSKFMQQMHQHK